MKLRITKRLLITATLGLIFAAMPSQTKAAYVLTLQETAGNVVASGSGSFNLAALTVNSTGNVGFGADVHATFAQLYVGSLNGGTEDIYQGLSGPANFGSGGLFFPNSGGGNLAGVQGTGGLLLVPGGYTSGTILSGSDTWTTATLSSLGVTPGTYTYTWGSGPTADSFTINAITGAVPEPSTWATLVAGVGMLIGFRRRRAG
jgi:hypothetical protein